MAELQLLNLLKTVPESPLYRLYLERISLYRTTSPGEHWDGAFTFERK